MIKSFAVWLGVATIVMFAGAGAMAQSDVNATGNWSVTPSGEPLATGTVRLEQDGETIVGSFGQSGRIDGKVEPGTRQINANWTDSRGTGWMTIIFAADGSKFSGDWGHPGSKPSGSFVAVRSAFPRVTGVYNIHTTGGTDFTSRQISLNQLGLDVVGNYGPGTQLNGTMATDANTLTGTWKGASGNGWVKLQFAADSKSFQGSWGLEPGSEASGQFAGSSTSIVQHTGGQLGVKGIWHIASSGAAFSSDVLQLEQEGHNVTGSYKGGHLEGTISRGSRYLSGTWRDARGSGVFSISFASDGMSFHGTWTSKSNNTGSIIGKRVIAATPALRQ
ncbi:MAG: hypothetical protein WBE79_02260 [Candidatus Cybelea sp.]